MAKVVEVFDRGTGEVVDVPAHVTGSAIVRYERPAPLTFGEVLGRLATPQALEQQKQLMGLYDQAVNALVGPNDVQEEGGKQFKKKSAWRKIGRFFEVSTEVVHVEKGWALDEAEGVRHYYAEVHVRGIAPWGQYTVAIGACSTREKRFYRTDRQTGALYPNENARGKAEHDCVATAATRATNRAVSDLVAAGEVSAEEVEGGHHEEHDATPQPNCPKCGGRMWDNRRGKKNPKAPDFKCRTKTCDGAFWPGEWPPKADDIEDAEEVTDAAEATLNAIAERMMHPTITEAERDAIRAWMATERTVDEAATQLERLKKRIANREAKTRGERQDATN